MASLLSSTFASCCRSLVASTSRLPTTITTKRGVRFNDWGAHFRARSVEGRSAYLSRRFPKKGSPLGLVTDPTTPLYRVRLTKQPRKLGEAFRKTAETMGFGKDGKKRLKVVWLPQTEVWAGKILKLKSIVSVKVVTEEERRDEVEYRRQRKSIVKGYEVIGRAEDMIV